jgi:hypothetical protein
MSTKIRAVSLALIILCGPSKTLGASMTISPSCGTSTTQFILGAAGFRAGSPCEDCNTNYSINIDGEAFASFSAPADCLPGFSLNITEKVLADCPPVCSDALGLGVHTVTIVANIECSFPTPSPPQECIVGTYTVTGTATDPWVNDLRFAANATLGHPDTTHVEFSPAGACDVPPCSNVVLEQSIRLLILSGSDTLCAQNVQYNAIPSEVADDMHGLYTPLPDCTAIDASPRESDPYMNGLDPLDTGSSGRAGANPKATTTHDEPDMALSNPTSSDTLLAEFEVNAYCRSGPAKGRFLGKTFWLYKRAAGAKGVLSRDPRRPPDLDQPTSRFLAADALWRQTKGFPKPQPSPPKGGGAQCP